MIDAQITKISHEETKQTLVYYAQKGKYRWEIRDNDYLCTIDGVKVIVPKTEDYIEEDLDTNMLTCNGISIGFCPRGYWVGSVYCALASMAFAMHKINGGSIRMYDDIK